MPTSEWKAATSSGIDVIGTRRATTAPIEPPIAMPTITSTQARPSAGRWRAEGGGKGKRHPDHADQIARAGGGGAQQAAQREDKQPTRHEIQYCREIGVHLRSPICRGDCRSLGFLLVHPQHAL